MVIMKKMIFGNDIKDKAYNFIYRLFWICFCVMLIYIFGVRKAQEFPCFRIEILVVLSGILLFLIKRNIAKFPVVLFVCSFLIRVLIVFLIKTEPISDFKLMFESARMLVEGDYSFNEYMYFQMWPYQIGFVVWEAVFLKMWNSIWMLKILNSLLSAGINLLIYFIAKELLKEEKGARFSAIIYMIFPFSVLHVTVLSNSHASGFFLFLGIYILICSQKSRCSIASCAMAAICIALGNLLRPDGLILLVSIAIWVIFLILKVNKVKEIKKIIVRALIFFGTYILIINIAVNCVQVTGISPKGLGNENPLWKFVVGTNYDSNGSFSYTDDEYVRSEMNNNEVTYEEIEIPMIKDRVSHKKKMLCLLDRKVRFLWWENAIEWSFSNEEVENYPEMIDSIVEINKAIWSIILLLVGIGMIKWYKLGNERKEALLIPFIIFASFSVYLLIEVQPRYLYLIQIAVFVMSAGGINYMLENLKKISCNLQEKRD